MENKLNLPPFYIGQRVVYITGKNMPKDSVHTVSAINQAWCGCWEIAINGESLKIKKSNKPMIRCVGCEKRRVSEGFVYDNWLASSFRPLQQTSFPLMTFSKIVEKEKEEVLINN